MSKGVFFIEGGEKTLLHYQSITLQTSVHDHGIHMYDGTTVYLMIPREQTYVIKYGHGVVCTCFPESVMHLHTTFWYLKDCYDAVVLLLFILKPRLGKDVVQLIAKELWKHKRDIYWVD